MSGRSCGECVFQENPAPELPCCECFAIPGKPKWTPTADAPDDNVNRQSAPGILREAAATIDSRGKERDQSEGERSMARAVGAFWTLYGAGILLRGYMTETDGWEFMSVLKKARKAGGAFRYDDYLDDTAYCALSAESALKGEEETP